MTWDSASERFEIRIQELEAELKAERDSVKEFLRQSNDARAENERLHAYGAAAEVRVRELTEENERARESLRLAVQGQDGLRKDLADADIINARNCDDARVVLESSLADATELLRDFSFAGAEQMCEWLKRRGYFLANQPAAPSLGHPGADEVFARLQDARRPAAPTRAESESPPLTQQDTFRKWERERAERAVLDACAAWRSDPTDIVRAVLSLRAIPKTEDERCQARAASRVLPSRSIEHRNELQRLQQAVLDACRLATLVQSGGAAPIAVSSQGGIARAELALRAFKNK